MSDQLPMFPGGVGGLSTQTPSTIVRASLAREMRYLLSISSNAGGSRCVGATGIAHSLGVCLIEDSNMARGKGKGGDVQAGSALPRFVDVKLTAEHREAFAAWSERDGDLVGFLQALADNGYRVGVSWSGERQSYTVSVTCREVGSVNNGLCMTSFAGTLTTALWLAVYKHLVVTSECWLENAAGGGEDFG